MMTKKSRIYFDNAATTPVSHEVVEVMAKILRENYGNPSSIHSDGRQSRSIIEQARKTVAKTISSSIGEVFFTSGGTESNNMALTCSVRDLGVKRIITTPIEHHCNLHTIENLEKCYPGTQIVYLSVDDRGRVNLDEIANLLKEDIPTMVSVMHANNEIGTLNDIKSIGEICKEHHAYFHSDTVQTIGHFKVDVSDLHIHFLSGAAHKFHGPKGVGFIYINNDILIHPLILGGSQERNMRAGTENLYGIAGLAKALELATDNLEERAEHIEKIRATFLEALTKNFSNILINGDYDGNYLFTVLSVCFPPSPKAELAIFNLDIAGISASGGSACSSGAEKGSHVLEAIKSRPGTKTIRFSFSHYNNLEEVDRTIEVLKTMFPELVNGNLASV